MASGSVCISKQVMIDYEQLLNEDHNLVDVSEIRVLPVRHILESSLIDIRSFLDSHTTISPLVLPAEHETKGSDDCQLRAMTKDHAVNAK